MYTAVMMERDDFRLEKVYQYDEDDVQSYQRSFSQEFCLSSSLSSSLASDPSLAAKFESLARILIFFYWNDITVFFQEVIDYVSITAVGDGDIRNIPPQSFDHFIRPVSFYPQLICRSHIDSMTLTTTLKFMFCAIRRIEISDSAVSDKLANDAFSAWKKSRSSSLLKSLRMEQSQPVRNRDITRILDLDHHTTGKCITREIPW